MALLLGFKDLHLLPKVARAIFFLQPPKLAHGVSWVLHQQDLVGATSDQAIEVNRILQSFPDSSFPSLG